VISGDSAILVNLAAHVDLVIDWPLLKLPLEFLPAGNVGVSYWAGAYPVKRLGQNIE
jgi:hypothetical protein